MSWTTPRTFVAGELVSAATLNTALRDQLRSIGEWAPGDLKATYRTHANAATSTLTEMEEGWLICNGASYSSATYPLMHAAIGSPNPPTLPDFRGRAVFAPGTQDSHAFARGESGGEYDHTLTVNELAAHTHPAHSHQLGAEASGSTGWGYGNSGGYPGAWAAGGTSSVVTPAAGGDAAHLNMPPYLVAGAVLIKRDW